MSISTLVLLGLATVWSVVLAPEIIRRTASLRNGDSVSAFTRQLSSIGRQVGGRRTEHGLHPLGVPAPQVGPDGPRPTGATGNVVDLRSRRVEAERRPVHPSVRRRRQEVLGGLVPAAVLTLLCTVAFGGAFIWLHLLVDVLLVGYVYLLLQAVGASPAINRPAVTPRRHVVDLTDRPSAAASLYAGLDDAGLAITRVTPIPGRRAAN